MEQVNKFNERLFWKVFRNKLLFKQIFKPSTFKLGIYSYYECNRYDWMVNNGYLELLKDKVFRNDKNLKINIKNMFTIFKKDNQSFFSILFKNYPSLIFEKAVESSSLSLSPQSIPQQQLSNKCIELIIENNNLSAFQVITDKNAIYKYQPTFSNLIESIKYGSFDISTYILNNYFKPNQFNKSQTDQIWLIAIGYNYSNCENLVYYADIEFYIKKCNYFFANILNNESLIKTIPEPPKIENNPLCPIDVFNNINESLQSKEVNQKLKKLKNLYRGCIYGLTVDLIVDICLNILNILKYQNSSIEFSNQLLPSFIILENELINMKFKYCLDCINKSSPLSQKIKIGEFDSSNEDIKRLLIMVLYFTRDRINHDFILAKYYNNNKSGSLSPIDFAIYDEKKLYIPVSHSPFKYCKNDNNGEKVKNYIKHSIQCINDQLIQANCKYTKNQLLEICFKFDDLSMVEMVYEEFQNDHYFPSLNTFEYIKSIKVFDYVFKKLLDDHDHINSESNRYLDILEYIICNRFDLANHFKSNYSTYYYLSIPRVSNSFFKRNHNEMEFVYNNFYDFKKEQFDPNQNLNQLLFHYLNNNRKEIHKLSMIPRNENIYNFYQFGNPVVLFHQLNHLLVYKIDEFKECIQVVPINKKFYFYYLRGELQEMLLNGTLSIGQIIEPFNYSSIFLMLLLEIEDRNDLETKNFLLDFYSNNKNAFDYLHKNLFK
ncbi:hypothetical protein ACTFIU_010834 [Dictyostelium citrinum]